MSTENEPVEVEPTTVTLPDPDPPANDNGDEPSTDDQPQQGAAPQADRPTRRVRRENELRNERVARASAEARLQAAIEASQRQAEQIAELRGRTLEIQRQQTQAQGDPIERQVTELENKAERHLANAAAAVQNKDEATRAAEMREYHRALRQAATIEARQEMAAEFQRYGQSQPNPEMAGMKVNLASEFPWLAVNTQARSAADGYIAVLMAKGRPNNLATFREACAMAAKEFNLGGADHERPSEARRSAYSGVSAREGGGGDDRTQIQMTGSVPEQVKKLAAQMYPSLEKEDAYKKWLKDIGPGLARK